MASNLNLNIENLAEIAEALPVKEKSLFRRIYSVTTTTGELCLPPGMAPWVRQQFGSVENITTQRITRVTNRVTGEESLFNRLRALRPMQAKDQENAVSQLQGAGRQDSFRNPENNTPADLFGRVTGKHCVTASNIAKYEGLHGVVIFNESNPLRFSREQIIDYIDTGQEWARRAQATNPQAKYFFFFWNCLWRAGASIHHGHAQVVVTGNRHYARIEGLRQAALSYQQNHGSNYFDDLFQIHYSLGCAIEKEGVRILACLTPFKDKEVILLAEELALSLKERVYEVLACFRDKLQVCCFNLSLVTRPSSETTESWEGFPAMVRLVDRGDPNSQASDVGGMEIYGASIIADDPFDITRHLRYCLTIE